ncbi:MAG: hypothetical protein ACI9N9_002323 [Enterobacterales bacterium]|jgi:hypothetical protein
MNNKSLLIPVFLLIFLGQSIAASAIPCQMDMTTTIDQAISQTIDHNIDHNIDHSAHNMAQDTTNCGLDCDCPMASCVSVVITSIDNLVVTQQPPIKFLLLSSQHTTQSLTSLYRPPITR